MNTPKQLHMTDEMTMSLPMSQISIPNRCVRHHLFPITADQQTANPRNFGNELLNDKERHASKVIAIALVTNFL